MSTPVVEVAVRGEGSVLSAVRAALSTVRPAAPAAVVVPAVPGPGPLAELGDDRLDALVGDTLDAVLADVRATLGQPLDRLVFVLPHAPLMGVADGVAASAVAHGVLSMARTLAIELARDGVTVNVVAADVDAPAPGALAAQLGALLGAGGEAITGQEIYLTAGTDLGRARP
ncbi:hypothetical protein PHK61_14780 [Actinomycetospora lutea]|uniref:hypothetical protein n=1 Tax=Actinomycetospora lutea TaxID=663604 RepID=UPI00236533D3|nr:hypothetical protein [Actinomycetospora lutea]MDD7939687.1 hypothetical protein [Actinomycetospora lutea]